MLDGVRVLDLTDEPGWLAGKILGDLGADVVKVEPPGGETGRQAPAQPEERRDAADLRWLAENTSKRGIVLDLTQQAGRSEFLDLVMAADVLLETAMPGWMAQQGLGWETLSARNPRLVHCAITPFGGSGPRATLRANDLVVVAMGGNASMTGDPDRPPLRCSAPTSHHHAAAEAAVGVAMALYAREHTGRGQHVDVSMHECQLGTLLSAVGQYALLGRLPRRSGARTGRTREIWAAKDGFVSFGLRGGPTRIPNLIATVELMAESGMAPPWLRDYAWETYDSARISDPELTRLEEAFGAFFRTQTLRELFDEALRRRILLAPCNDAHEVLEQPQLRARDFFTTLETPDGGAGFEHPAFFVRSNVHALRVSRRAPRPGEHQAEVLRDWRSAPVRVKDAPARPVRGETHDEKGIFRGVRILELGSGAAGPGATRYFAEQGATVVRIESRARPDFLRLLQSTPGLGLDGSPMFILLNANKRSVALNLAKPAAVALVKRLASWADAVVESFAPGVLERLGLDYPRLCKRKPDLVMLSSSLFGQSGPQRSYPGFGGQGSAIAGFNHLTGWPDREPHGPWATITDSLSQRYAAVALAAALRERLRTGRGQYLDLSQIEVGVYSLGESVVRCSARREAPSRRGNHDARAAPHAIYPCRGEDRWIAIAVLDDASWRGLVKVLGEPEWACEPGLATLEGRLARQVELDQRLAVWTRVQEAETLMQELQAAGVAAGVVQDFRDLLADPQLSHRNHFVRLRHPCLGELVFEQPGFRLSAAPGLVTEPGPDLGADTRAVLGEALGLSLEEIAELETSGVTA